MIKIYRNWLLFGRLHQHIDVTDQTIVGDAFVVKGWQYQRAGETKPGSMTGECDSIRYRRGAGTDHEAVQRQSVCLVGVHDRFALVERKGRGFSGGTKNVEAVTAVVEQMARQIDGAFEIGRAALVDRRSDRGDYAGKCLAQVASPVFH